MSQVREGEAAAARQSGLPTVTYNFCHVGLGDVGLTAACTAALAARLIGGLAQPRLVTVAPPLSPPRSGGSKGEMDQRIVTEDLSGLCMRSIEIIYHFTSNNYREN